MNADLVGLLEIENDGYGAASAIVDLVSRLNNVVGAGVYTFAQVPGAAELGTDEISVGLIYKAASVAPVGDAVTTSSGVFGFGNRQPLVQSFKEIKTNEVFTVAVNHFKSKGSCPGSSSPDRDFKDGQSCWNATRVQAATQLMSFLNTAPTGHTDPDMLIIGDLNAYAKEDPILALEQANYKVLLNDEKIGQGKAAYSYVFGVASNAQGYGGAGNLDHAIADAALYPLVKKAFAWHINADEPTALDYNEEYKTEEQIAAFYADDAYRSSDHDPVIVDLDLNDAVVNDDDKTHAGSTGLWSALGLIGLALYGSLRRRKNQS
mgnify:CR=1 FL=1